VSECAHNHQGGEAQEVVERLTANRTFPHGGKDPTGTTKLRDRYAGEMYRRFRALKGLVRQVVVEDDAFNLKSEERLSGSRAEQRGAAQERDRFGMKPPRNGFDFPNDARKIEEFSEWLDAQVDKGILERVQHNRGARDSWQHTYIRNAYRKGVEHAEQAMQSEGIASASEVSADAFNAPRHTDAAQMLYARAYRELDGVTAKMGQEMSRTLAEGLTQGKNPRAVARDLNDRVDKVGIRRGRLIARTETIRAHNEGALNRYQDFEKRMDGVTVKAEWSTAADARVCPRCAMLEGRRFKMKEARGLIPLHPLCRCTVIPVRQNT
jgi:SPP1 gp7 family putative phage head morphogenesis protein